MTFDGGDERPLTLARDDAGEASPRLGRKALIGGVVTACLVVAGLGFAAKPHIVANAPRPAAMTTPPRDPASQMDIVMAQPPPPEPAPKSSPLEVMSPDLARAAAASTPTPPAEPAEPVEFDAPAPAPEAAQRRPERREDASFDCEQATSDAEEMVCSDPALAAADRHLARAYQRALRLGVPYDLLQAEQNNWMAIREQAARHSPRAVAALYDQRIEQLNAMTRGPGPDW